MRPFNMNVFSDSVLCWLYSYLIHPVADKQTFNQQTHAHSLTHAYQSHVTRMSLSCHVPCVCVCVCESSVVARNSIASSEIFSRIFRCHLKNMKAFAFCIFIMRNLAFETGIPYHTLSLSGSQSIISYRNSKSVSITKIQLKCSTCCKSVGKVFRLIAT